MVVQPGLCRTRSETPKTSFLTTRLKCKLESCDLALVIHVNVAKEKLSYTCIRANKSTDTNAFTKTKKLSIKNCNKFHESMA